MIFVTVGSTHFDALTRCVDEAVGAGRILEPVVLQIGFGGTYVPKHVTTYFRIAPTLEPFERDADLVIGHGGTGTTLEVLLLGRPLISVANPAVKDNHQHEFLDALERQNLVTYCRDLSRLPELIANRDRIPRSLRGTSELAAALDGELRELGRRHRAPAESWLRRLASGWVKALEVDPATVFRQVTPGSAAAPSGEPLPPPRRAGDDT